MDFVTAKTLENTALLREICLLIEGYSEQCVCERHNQYLKFPGMEIGILERSVILEGTPIVLTGKEFDVLRLLAAHPSRVYTKKQIYREVWEEVPEDIDNTVMCLIYSLRKKLAEKSKHQYIRTVYGVGYKFVAD